MSIQKIKTQPESNVYYVSKLRGFISDQPYRSANYKLYIMFGHVIFILANFVCIKMMIDQIGIIILCSALIGLSITCLFLYSHELSHGTIIKKEPWLYFLQNFFWAFVGIPPTVWKRVHNASHHLHTNTPNDPDRKTLVSEKNIWNGIYNLFIYPNKKLRYSLTVGFAMIFYALKHIVAVYYQNGKKPAIVTYRPSYSEKEISRVTFELIYIIFFWSMLAIFIGSNRCVLAFLISWITYSAASITLIITQHLHNPIFEDISDPLLTTTSVKLPRWLDRIIDWHGFHVEHHLFPGINFDHYPALSLEIEKQFPEKYHRKALWKAIKESYDQDVFMEDPMI